MKDAARVRVNRKYRALRERWKRHLVPRTLFIAGVASHCRIIENNRALYIIAGYFSERLLPQTYITELLLFFMRLPVISDRGSDSCRAPVTETPNLIIFMNNN